ncbi:MAG: PAS domain S-box protein [Betaproteobacteria bacterium]|nr:PAS domain S-box protein [Betaproteobacteria bacterium]
MSGALSYSIFFGSAVLPDGGSGSTTGLPWVFPFLSLAASIAFCAIAVALLVLTRRQRDLPVKWLFGLFAAVALFSGASHLLEVWNVLPPLHWLRATILLAIALTAAVAAGVLWPLVLHGGAGKVRSRLHGDDTGWVVNAHGAGAGDVPHEKIATYRDLFETNPMPMWVRNAETGGFLAVNDAAVRLYGYTRNEFLRMTGLDLRLAEDRAAYIEFTRHRRADEATVRRWRHVKKDGTPIEVEVTAHGFTFQGRPARLGVVKDITEQIRAEHALQESEQRYRDLFDLNPGSMWVYDFKTLAFVAVNEAATRQYGYTKSDFSRMTVTDLLLPEDVPNALDTIRDQGPQAVVRRAIRQRTKEGDIIDVEILASPLPHPQRTLRIVHATDVTQRRRTEAALRESEERLRLAMKGSQLALWDWNFRSGTIYLDEHWRVMLGGAAEPTLTTLPELARQVHPDDVSALDSHLRQALKGEIPLYDFEHRVRTVSGDWRWIRSQGEVVERGPDGRALRLAGTNQDISERKRAQHEQRESEERYRRVIEMSPSPILLRRAEHVIFANPAAVRFFAAPSAADLVGRVYFTLIDPEERERSKQRWETIRDAGMVTPPEVRKFRRVDGAVVYGETSGAPFHYAGERCGITTIHDVTGQRKAAEALATERNLLRSVIDTLPDQIYVKNRARRYLLVNAASLKARGLETHEGVVGKTVYEFYPRESAAAFDAEDEAVMHSGEPILGREQSRVESDDDVRWYLTDKVPLRDAGGAVIGVIGIDREVTEVRVATEAIRRLNAELEERVRERTAELEVANKELESFAYSVSHDLRAPLRSIDGFSRALLEDYRDRLDDTGKDYLRRVRNATLRMGNLIDDLLTLSRITRSEMRQENVNVSTVAREIAAELQTDDPEREVEFEIQTGIRAKADLSLLRVALQNLLYNAWKFTGRAAKSRIEFGTVRREGRQVYFVRDNGVGFDMAYADKLFGAFQRLHSESEFPGTGVGLATVQRIVRRHGGDVWAEGAVDRGATFFFTLGRAGKQRAHADAVSDTDG